MQETPGESAAAATPPPAPDGDLSKPVRTSKFPGRKHAWGLILRLLLYSAIIAPVYHDAGPSRPSFARSDPSSNDQPNFVFILADDLGYTDLSCQGSKYYETPHIDRLAAQGLRFTDAYAAAPNCAPSRAALLSGQYGPRTGIYTVGSTKRSEWEGRRLRPVENVTSMPAEKVLLPQALQNAGYATGMFGKWQLGSDRSHHPSRRGFDDALVSAGKHFDFETHPKVTVPPGAYLADFLTDKALDFIRAHKEDRFFLYLSHFGVHAPHQAKEELIARFRGKAADQGHDDPVYAAMIASIDESLGRIVELLDNLQLAQKTVVIFSSDNGGLGGFPKDGPGKGKSITDNAPLRSGKGSLYEGGIRVPFIWKWPGRIAPGVCATPIISVDLYPTLLELAGAPSPSQFVLDGVSIVPLLRGESVQRESLYWHFPVYVGGEEKAAPFSPAGAIRSGHWKLLEHFEDGRVELFNLEKDIGESRNLAQENPSVTSTLLGSLHEWRKATAAPMPIRNQ